MTHKLQLSLQYFPNRKHILCQLYKPARDMIGVYCENCVEQVMHTVWAKYRYSCCYIIW